jgi:hypothetical protein
MRIVLIMNCAVVLGVFIHQEKYILSPSITLLLVLDYLVTYQVWHVIVKYTQK